MIGLAQSYLIWGEIGQLFLEFETWDQKIIVNARIFILANGYLYPSCFFELFVPDF